MKKGIRATVLALFAVAGISGASSVQAHVGGGNPDLDNSVRVTICHSHQPNQSNGDGQGPIANPYDRKTVDDDSIIDEDGQPNTNGANGHGGHSGPVYSGPGQNYWGDIIPSFTDHHGNVYAGMNWDSAGQAIWNNECKPVIPGQGGDPKDPIVPVMPDEPVVPVTPVVPVGQTEIETPVQPQIVAASLPYTGSTNSAIVAIIASVVAALAAGISYIARRTLVKEI